MRNLVFAFALLALPAGAFALDYTDQSLMYLDAPFRPADAAGISLLTNISAVQGNPDGTFQPDRTLNRAEFLKIALASHPRILVSPSDAARCFPDVSREDWFSPYVCLAKKRGIVAGYPDGFFRPENPVNYAEALKMLGELYEYTAYAEPDAPWYQVYVQAAVNHKTILPINIAYDRYLTRGQMARLAAAYRAENEGELPYYRQAERGERVVVPEPEEPAEEPEIPEEPPPPPEEPAAESVVPVQSNFLMVGERQAIADALLFPREEPAELRLVKVVLEREARSLEALFLRDEAGTEIGTMKLDLYDRSNETWKVEFAPGGSEYVLPPRSATRLVVDAKIKDRGQGGFSEDWVEVKNIIVMVSETQRPEEGYQIVPTGAHYPAHQTVQARPASVESLLTGSGELTQGSGLELGSFGFVWDSAADVNFRIRHLRFRVHTSRDVAAANWQIRSAGSAWQYPCTTEATDSLTLYLVNCLAIPEELGRESVVDLHANVDLSQASRGDTLQVNLEVPGSLAESGDVRWADGAAEFQWVPFAAPLAEGRIWKY